ncbi:MAG: hypothetical protein QGH59_08935 [Gemmatimonadota bacterium]|nr:hypothetical protein [Gemmatimonadota bacterium]
MKRILVLAALVLFSLATVPGAHAEKYAWTISSSTTDPCANTAAPAGGVGFFSLWVGGDGDYTDGWSAAEFDIGGTMTVYAFAPENGVLNAGGATNLMLAVGGCPDTAFVAGTIMAQAAGGTLYPEDSAANGLNVTVNCAATDMFLNDYIGLSTDGSAPVESVGNQEGSTLCGTTPRESESWGGVKALYR